MKQKIDVGAFVRSNFRSPWFGIIQSFEVTEGSGQNSKKICNVLILKDKNKNNMRIRTVKVLSDGWLDVVEPFDLTEKQINWIENNTLRGKLLSP